MACSQAEPYKGRRLNDALRRGSLESSHWPGSEENGDAEMSDALDKLDISETVEDDVFKVSDTMDMEEDDKGLLCPYCKNGSLVDKPDDAIAVCLTCYFHIKMTRSLENMKLDIVEVLTEHRAACKPRKELNYCLFKGYIVLQCDDCGLIETIS